MNRGPICYVGVDVGEKTLDADEIVADLVPKKEVLIPSRWPFCIVRSVVHNSSIIARAQNIAESAALDELVAEQEVTPKKKKGRGKP